jgi:hypothetical protein
MKNLAAGQLLDELLMLHDGHFDFNFFTVGIFNTIDAIYSS